MGERNDVEWIVTCPALFAVEYVDKNNSLDFLLEKGATGFKNDEIRRFEAQLEEMRAKNKVQSAE